MRRHLKKAAPWTFKQLEELTTRRLKEDRGAFWIGIAFVLIALALPGYQAFLWLQQGVWHPMPISGATEWMGLRVQQTHWVGLQKIINLIFDLPAFVIPGFLAFGSFCAWSESLKRR